MWSSFQGATVCGRERAVRIANVIGALGVFSGSLFSVMSVASAESSDEIRGSIVQQIDQIPGLKGYDLDIQAHSGMVSLRGKVASETDRTKVDQIAKGTKGVRTVNDLLTVSPLPEVGSSELARNVQTRVHPITSMANHAVTISANEGIVTLAGVTSSELSKQKIGEAARSTPGVLSVVNQIVVRRPDDNAISENIVKALNETTDLNITNLSVKVQNGVASLAGESATHRDTDRALSIALNIDGVEDVKSDFKEASHK